MQCGLYGKLPTKRDFVAIRMSHFFLELWEPWLQRSVSASRATLEDDWQKAFLTAPIWRFWIGGDLCGTSVIGAFMPSLDGVGRYFPLTLFACADLDAAIPPPELDPQDEWFKSAEDFLMSTLDHGTSFEATTAALDALAPPHQDMVGVAAPNILLESDGTLGIMAGERKFSDLFASLRTADHARIYGGTTCWWTVGGEGFAPMTLFAEEMPDPYLFSAMLNGQFSWVGD